MILGMPLKLAWVEEIGNTHITDEEIIAVEAKAEVMGIGSRWTYSKESVRR